MAGMVAPLVIAALHFRGGQGLTFVPMSAQLELTLPLFDELELTASPM